MRARNINSKAERVYQAIKGRTAIVYPNDPLPPYTGPDAHYMELARRFRCTARIYRVLDIQYRQSNYARALQLSMDALRVQIKAEYKRLKHNNIFHH